MKLTFLSGPGLLGMRKGISGILHRKPMEMRKGNYLKMAEKQRILASMELGWSYRRIERGTGVRRVTVDRYEPNKASKADNPSTGSGAKPAKVYAAARGPPNPTGKSSRRRCPGD